MSTIVLSKVSYFENYKKQFDFINENLNVAHVFETNHLSDCIHYLINHNKQAAIAHNDIKKKYQSLLLQEKEMIDNEIYKLSNGNIQQNYNRFIQMNKQDNEIIEDVISRRVTSIPTFRSTTQSAYVSLTTYHPIIRFTTEELLDWWYDCTAGNRFIGYCSRTALTIWFLLFERWRTQSRRMPSGAFITDAAALPDLFDCTDDSDDEDENENED
ncbi:unnamed protein product [Adineta steineri]|uniref:Uncharacterized protein n=1 Tax=Adineta steineri TaxID=433720 RepID=A0A818ZDN9_9BILA|nr:unnamed protein product [Adineta steineri]CAF3763498.1 unnamed protein product [Adineta steineri]